MARARVRVEADGDRNRLIVECHHGVAHADVPADIDPLEKATNAMPTAILRHYRAFRCRCTAHLWRQWTNGNSRVTLTQVARELDRAGSE